MNHRGRTAWHQPLFVAAGIYNLAWGAYSAVDPQWLFRWSGLAPLNHPAIFSCLAMVVGIYGLLYLEVARRPREGFAIAAVGLLGKILGPLGLAVLIARGVWPLAASVVCITNDLIWLIPFALYLRETWPRYRDAWTGTG